MLKKIVMLFCLHVFGYLLIGMLALSGHPVSGEVYAWAAVFILPVNSALNPLLYTLSAIIGVKVNALTMYNSIQLSNKFIKIIPELKRFLLKNNRKKYSVAKRYQYTNVPPYTSIGILYHLSFRLFARFSRKR